MEIRKAIPNSALMLAAIATSFSDDDDDEDDGSDEILVQANLMPMLWWVQVLLQFWWR